MRQVKLRRIYGRHFRGLAPFDIRLPETGLVLIKGTNKDTGDSSDSGKTSLLLAIAHLFGGCPYPATELQSWNTEEPYLVGAELDTPEGAVTVERSKGLVVKTTSKTHKGGAAEAELDRLFGMDAATRALVTYRGQRQPGLFLNMPDDKKKELFAGLLGLSRYETLEADAENRFKEFTIELDQLEQRISAIAENAEQLRTTMSALPPAPDLEQLQTDLHRNVAGAGALAVEAKVAAQQVQQIKNRSERRVKELVEQLRIRRQELLQTTTTPAVPPLLAEAREALKVARASEVAAAGEHAAKVAAIKAKGSAAVARAKLRPHFEATLRQVKEEQARLVEQECPTCLRPWQTSEALDRLAEVVLAIKTAEQELKACDDAKHEAQTAAVELKALGTYKATGDVDAAEARVAELEREASAQVVYQSRIRQLKVIELEAEAQTIAATAQAELQQALREPEEEAASLLQRARQAEEQAAATRSTLAAALQIMKQRDQFAELLTTVEARLEEAKTSAAKIKENRNTEADLIALVGKSGFLGHIFAEVLDECSAIVNDILSQVANVRHVSFRWKSEKETKKGSISTRITPSIRLRGDERPLRSAVSGGMQSAIHLAVDLAVGRIATGRRNATPGWLILDESFEGLGDVSKESCFEALSVAARDRLILVVDHSARLIGMFSETISLVSEDGMARIAQT